MWTFIDLFAGIGGFRIALENLGCQCVFSSEIDPHSQKVYLANYGHLPDNQDIRKLEVKLSPIMIYSVAVFPVKRLVSPAENTVLKMHAEPYFLKLPGSYTKRNRKLLS